MDEGRHVADGAVEAVEAVEAVDQELGDGSDAGAEALVARLREGLATFGHEHFRPGQEQALQTLLRERRLLFVAPTGGGKSLIYQLPALLLPGTSLVVSPLVSLMRDQVEALLERGVAATYLAATLEPEELRARMRGIARGDYKLVYAAPERMVFEGFRSLLRDLSCPLVAIDEAHCIAEWGHDFRPEYLELGSLLAELSSARVLACTATATPIVRDEILERLGLPPDTAQLVRGFARPNLSLRFAEVESSRERQRMVDTALAEALEAPGAGRGAAIVYAPTRRAAEACASRLAERGWRAACYHAGLGGAERDAAHEAFSCGDLEVVAATNAFGMGIDRSDVRAVVHLAPPGSVEAYYQEVGRAGRDGEEALGLLLTSTSDWPRRRHLIEADGGDPEGIRHRWGLFLELMRLSESGSCRHDAILRYFGDEAETLAGCGRCDVCRQLAGGHLEASREETELYVRKALSGVARCHDRYGLSAVVALLRGQRDTRLAQSGLDATRTFGVLSEEPEPWLLALLRRCISAGWVDFRGGDRPVVVLTAEGRAVMQGEREVRMLLPEKRERRSGAPRAARAAASAEAEALLDEAGQGLFEALRQQRLELARDRGVPPYVVASDRTLREIALLRPKNVEELERVHGVGPAKVEQFGDGWLSVVHRHEVHEAPSVA